MSITEIKKFVELVAKQDAKNKAKWSKPSTDPKIKKRLGRYRLSNKLSQNGFVC